MAHSQNKVSFATRKTTAVKAKTTATPATKKSKTFRKGAQGKSLPKRLRTGDGKDNDLVLIHLSLANDLQCLTIMGAIEVYNAGVYEFQMYRKEYEYMRDELLETELDAIEYSVKRAERKQGLVNEKLAKGAIGNRQASMEMQSCNAPAFFYQDMERGMKPLRSIELVQELGQENTAANEREALIKKLSSTI